MNFLKYIFELILVFYILRFAVRAIDGFFRADEVKKEKWKEKNTIKRDNAPNFVEDIDYEEVR